jgi:opacity protein-like surface antigen
LFRQPEPALETARPFFAVANTQGRRFFGRCCPNATTNGNDCGTFCAVFPESNSQRLVVMRKLLTAIAAIAALAVGPAVAADMGLPPVYKAPPVAWNWTGFYAGINAGGGIATGEYLDPCFTCADIKVQPLVGTVGGQLGYNWQWQALVAGLEGDINWVSANKSIPNATDDGNLAGFANFKMDAFASIRGRMGLAYENALIYVTGGPAFGHFNQSVQLGPLSPGGVGANETALPITPGTPVLLRALA